MGARVSCADAAPHYEDVATSMLDADVIDTAYTNDELPLHTDGTYLHHQPGLQLFVCAEQAKARPGRPLDGSTKLADGFRAAAVLRAAHPLTYAYLCRVALPFHHVDAHHAMETASPVLETHPSTGAVVAFRLGEGPAAGGEPVFADQMPWEKMKMPFPKLPGF